MRVVLDTIGDLPPNSGLQNSLTHMPPRSIYTTLSPGTPSRPGGPPSSGWELQILPHPYGLGLTSGCYGDLPQRMPVEREIKGQDHSLQGMGESQHGPSFRPGGWTSTLLHACLLSGQGGGRRVQGRPTGGTPTLAKPSRVPWEAPPRSHTTGHQPRPVTRLRGGVWLPAPQPGRHCRDGGHSPKPAGGCWRGFCGPSLGSGWPRPRPPTAPGCGVRRGHTDGTHSNCGCPPAAAQDKAHRRCEVSAGTAGTPCTSSSQTSAYKKSWPSRVAGPVAQMVDLVLAVPGLPLAPNGSAPGPLATPIQLWPQANPDLPYPRSARPFPERPGGLPCSP